MSVFILLKITVYFCKTTKLCTPLIRVGTDYLYDEEHIKIRTSVINIILRIKTIKYENNCTKQIFCGLNVQCENCV